jgi:type III secretory pathway component EscT
MDWTLDAAATQELLASVLRAFGLTFGFFLVPRRTLPFAAKLATWSAVLICAPFDKAGSYSLGHVLVGLDLGINEILKVGFLTYTEILAELAIGLALGVSFGAALLFASILGQMLSFSVVSRTRLLPELSQDRTSTLLSTLPVLMSIALILGSGAYIALFRVVNDAYSTLPLLSTTLSAAGVLVICEVVVKAGGAALLLATYVFLPLALLLFVCDLTCILSQRMLKELEAHWIFRGLKIPLLSLFLVLSIHPFSEQIGVFFGSPSQSAQPIADAFQVDGR